MSSAEAEQRLQEGLERVARLEGRAVEEVRQEAIRGYLARRGIGLLDDLAGSSSGTSLTDDEAQGVSDEELDRMRRERRQ